MMLPKWGVERWDSSTYVSTKVFTPPPRVGLLVSLMIHDIELYAVMILSFNIPYHHSLLIDVLTVCLLNIHLQLESISKHCDQNVVTTS